MKILRQEKGVALIVALWAALAISIVVVQICRAAKIDLGSLDMYKQDTVAIALAESGLREAIKAVGPDAGEQMSGSGEMKDAAGNVLGTYEYVVINESGRMRLNDATQAELSVLLRLMKVDPAETLAARIVAFRDRYPGRKIQFTGETLLVDGLDATEFYGEDTDGDMVMDINENDGDKSWPPDDGDDEPDYGPARYLTAACDGKMDIRLAGREVLLASTGISPDAVEAVMATVEKDGGKFDSVLQIKSLGVEEISQLDEKFTDESHCFMIRAGGLMKESGARSEIFAYVMTDVEGGLEIVRRWEN